MKLKYYLRGMGIGVIVTTIILAISFSQKEVEISDEQVMVRAAALGMVMEEEQDIPASEDVPEIEEPVVSTQTTQETQAEETELGTESGTELGTAMQDGTYRLIIQKGDVCRVVCEKLQENGVVADAEALRKHLFELGYANSISTGSYDVPYGLTMEEVAQIIVAGPLEE